MREALWQILALLVILSVWASVSALVYILGSLFFQIKASLRKPLLFLAIGFSGKLIACVAVWFFGWQTVVVLGGSLLALTTAAIWAAAVIYKMPTADIGDNKSSLVPMAVPFVH